MSAPSGGAALPGRRFELDRLDLVRYAGAALDFNPIHWSDAAAHDAGLPDVLAHGMLLMALAGRVVTAALEDPTAILELSARFAAPVPVPARGSVQLEGGATIAEARADGTARVALSLRHGDVDVLKHATAIVRSAQLDVAADEGGRG